MRIISGLVYVVAWFDGNANDVSISHSVYVADLFDFKANALAMSVDVPFTASVVSTPELCISSWCIRFQ